MAARQRAIDRGHRGSRPPQPRDQSLHSTNKRRYFQHAVRSAQWLRALWVPRLPWSMVTLPRGRQIRQSNTDAERSSTSGGGASDRLLVARRVRGPALTHRVRAEAKKGKKKRKFGRQSMHVGSSCICSSPPCNGKGLVLVMFLVADQCQREGDEQGKK